MLGELWDRIWIRIFGNRRSGMTARERNEERRSKVRVRVTYGAALYIFLGSLILIIAFAFCEIDKDKLDLAKEIFTMVLPVAAGIVTYWFASRKADENPSDPEPKHELVHEPEPEPDPAGGNRI